MTFNPDAPGTSTPTPIKIDNNNPLNGVACPSTSQCTAVDYAGRQVTFDPTAPRTPTLAMIDTGRHLTGVACPSASQCVAVDDSSRAVEGDPGNPGSWTVDVLAGANPLNALNGVACSSAAQCVTVDQVGNGFVGSGFVGSAPKLGVSVNIAPVSGRVLVELPGTKKFVPLKSVKNVPIGSKIDARNGSMQLTDETSGGFQSAVFSGGLFAPQWSGAGKTEPVPKRGRVRGRRAGASVPSGELTAVLTGGSFAGCPKPPHAQATVAAAPKKKSKKIRQLWANAHGYFATRGQYGSATVSGTEWLTQDQCDGTYFHVTRDRIVVTIFTRHDKKITLKQGQHYLAPAPGY
ncbi:MAG: hypothetical protein ACLP8S_05850 [Solirubrobacteraceae bacterium]